MLQMTWALIVLTVSISVLSIGVILFVIYKMKHKFFISFGECISDTCALEASHLSYLSKSEPLLLNLDPYYPAPWQLDISNLTPNSAAVKIPKHIWRCVDDDWQQSGYRAIHKTSRSCPDWTQHNETSKEQLAYIESAYKNPKLNQLAHKIQNKTVLANLWKLLVAYDRGGLVLGSQDVAKDLSKLETKRIGLYTCTSKHNNNLLRGDAFLCYPRHPTILQIINQVCANLESLDMHEDRQFMRLYNDHTDSMQHRISCACGDMVFTYCAQGGGDARQTRSTTLLDKHIVSSSMQHLQDKSNPVLSQLMKHETRTVVPAILHLSWKNKDSVPQKVWDQLAKVVPSDYDVRFYSDEDCQQFILEEYGPCILELYNAIPGGAHRADVFRYAVLFKTGGIWLDIKTKPLVSLDEMFDRTVPFTTALTPTTSLVYQGILAAAPGLAILSQCFVDGLKYGHQNTRSMRTYQSNLQYMVNTLKASIKSPLKIGTNDGNRFTFNLLEERVRLFGNDRYGISSNLLNQHNKKLAKTRYDDFPWRSKK